MTVLSAIQKACPRIGLDVPTGVFASSERHLVELAELANDTAEMIGQEHTWQTFTKLNTVTGDGATEDWDLPEDYGWMPNDSQIWSSVLLAPLDGPIERNDWLRDLVQQLPTLPGRWIIFDDQLHIRAALASAEIAKFFYQSSFVCADNAGAPQAEFSADDDVFRLDERLLTLGMIYRWKLDKGLQYAQHQDEYAALLEKKVGRDKGPRTIAVGRPSMPSGVRTAWPGVLGQG